MAATAKLDISGISSNVRMRLHKWVGRTASTGKEKRELAQFEISSSDAKNVDHESRVGPANSSLGSSPIPIPKVERNFTSRGSNTSVTYLTPSYTESIEGSTAYHKNEIPSSSSHAAINSAHLDKELQNTSKDGIMQRIFGKATSNSSTKRDKGRTTGDKGSGRTQNDTKCDDKQVPNKRAAFKANKAKRTGQTSTDSSENSVCSDSDKQTSSFGTSLEEEEDKETNIEKLSEQIQVRLQKWVNKASAVAEKRDRRQSEESLTSSTDSVDGGPGPETEKAKRETKQAKEIRELESALKELVGNAAKSGRTRRLSRCDLLDTGSTDSSDQRSRKSSRQEIHTAPDLKLLGRTKRKTGSDSEAEGSTAVEEAEQGLSKQARNNDESDLKVQDNGRSKESQRTGGTRSLLQWEHSQAGGQRVSHGKLGKSDSGTSSEMEIAAGNNPGYGNKKLLTHQNSNSNNVRETRNSKEPHVICEVDTKNTVISHERTGPRNPSLTATRELQEVEECDMPGKEKRRLETTEELSSPSESYEVHCEPRPNIGSQSIGQSGKTEAIQERILEVANARLPVVDASEMETSSKDDGPTKPCIKKSSAPNSVYNLKMRADVRESMRHFLNFNDTDLSEFAVECVRHANKKKKRIRKKNSAGQEESCSGSDENTEDKDETAAGSSECEEAARRSTQNTAPVSDKTLTPLGKEPPCEMIKHGGQIFAKTTEESELLSTAPEMCRLRNAWSTCDAQNTTKLEEQRTLLVHRFPSMPMFYCPKEQTENAEKERETRSDSVASLKVCNRSLQKSRSTSNLLEDDAPDGAGKVQGRTSLNVPSMDPFYHGDTGKPEKVEKQRRINRLRPRSWFGKPAIKDENGNMQKRASPMLRNRKKNQRSSVHVSIEALI